MKNLLLVLSLLAMSYTLHAQLGVKTGLNFSAVGSYGNTEEGESASLKTGFQVGLLYKLELTSSIGLMAELNYERRGTVSKKDYNIMLPVVDPNSGAVLGIGDYAIDQEANSQQHYINIPVLLVLGSGKIKYYAGPNIGYMISGSAGFERTIDVSLGGNPLPSPTPVDLDDVDWFEYDSFRAIFVTEPPENGDFLNQFELGINVGVILNLTDRLFADVRINQGLTDTSNNDYDFSIYPDATTFQFPSRDDTDRNLSIQLTGGYMF